LFYRKEECSIYKVAPKGKYKSNVFVELKRSTKLMRNVSVIKSNMDRAETRFMKWDQSMASCPWGPGPQIFSKDEKLVFRPFAYRRFEEYHATVPFG